MPERAQKHIDQAWSPGQFFWGSVFFVLLAVIWLIGGLIFGSPPVTRAQPSPTPTPLSPEAVAGSFLSQVKLEYWDSAYDLLAAEQQEKLSPEQFRKALGEYWAKEDNRWDMRYRRPGEARLHGSVCTLTIRATRGEGRPWKWELRQQGQDWKVYELGGAFGL